MWFFQISVLTISDFSSFVTFLLVFDTTRERLAMRTPVAIYLSLGRNFLWNSVEFGSRFAVQGLDLLLILWIQHIHYSNSAVLVLYFHYFEHFGLGHCKVLEGEIFHPDIRSWNHYCRIFNVGFLVRFLLNHLALLGGTLWSI